METTGIRRIFATLLWSAVIVLFGYILFLAPMKTLKLLSITLIMFSVFYIASLYTKLGRLERITTESLRLANLFLFCLVAFLVDYIWISGIFAILFLWKLRSIVKEFKKTDNLEEIKNGKSE